MPIARIETEAALFDLDGTLVFSTEAVAIAWNNYFTNRKLTIDPNFFHDTHGMRTSETFKKYLSHVDDSGNLASAAFDVSILKDYGHLARPIVGGAQLIQSIPRDRWCVVTSGTSGIAFEWFDRVLIPNGLPKPEVFITAGDVTKGKPHPEPYLTGAAMLSLKLPKPVTKAVVFEDAPTGIKAGLAAGFPVIGIMSTFDAKTLYDSGVTYAVKDLSHVTVAGVTDTGFVLEVDYVEL